VARQRSFYDDNGINADFCPFVAALYMKMGISILIPSKEQMVGMNEL